MLCGTICERPLFREVGEMRHKITDTNIKATELANWN